MINTKLEGILLNLKADMPAKEYCGIIDVIWNDVTSATNRRDHKEILLELFYKLVTQCRALEYVENKSRYILDVYLELLGYFDIEIKEEAIPADHRKIYILFLKFLYSLKNQSATELEKWLEYFANNLMDNITDFNHLFALTDPEGEFLFSLKNLILVVTKKFENNQSDLLPLTFTVYLRSGIRCSEDDDKARLNALITKNNLEYLDLILNGNGKLIPSCCWVENYKHNGTIIVANSETAIVRNSSKTYFDGCSTILKETDQMAQPGYYIKHHIKNLVVKDLLNHLLSLNTNEKLIFLKELIDLEQYNVFSYNFLLVCPLSNKKEKLLNPFLSNDTKIIVDTKNGIDTRDSVLKNFLEFLRSASRDKVMYIFQKSKFEFITLNHLIEVFITLEKKEHIINFIDALLEELKTVSNQSVIECSLIALCKNKRLSLSEINAILSRYCGLYENIMTLKENRHIQAFPIKSIIINKISAEEILKYTYNIVTGSEYDFKSPIILKNGIIENVAHQIQITTDDGTKYHDYQYKITQFTSAFEEDRETGIFSDYSAMMLINETDRIITLLPSELLKIINHYNKLVEINDSVIDFDYLSELEKHSSRIEIIKDLIYSAGSIERSYKPLFNTLELDANSCEYLGYNKILQHLKIHRIDLGKIEKWIALILDYHYIEPALISKNKVHIVEFFSMCYNEYVNNGTLLIPLKSFGHDSTFSNYYDSCFRKADGRDWFKAIFDSAESNSKIKQNDDGFYTISIPVGGGRFEDKVIKKIMFITDIIMSGRAAEKDLNYHVKLINAVEHGETDYSKEFYAKQLVYIEKLGAIVKTNEPKLSIAAIYCEQNRSKFAINGVTVEIDDSVKSLRFDLNKFMYKKDSTNPIYQLFVELYGDRDVENDSFCCMIRFNNMPAKYLPKIVNHTKAYKMQDLFIRKTPSAYDHRT